MILLKVKQHRAVLRCGNALKCIAFAGRGDLNGPCLSVLETNDVKPVPFVSVINVIQELWPVPSSGVAGSVPGILVLVSCSSGLVMTGALHAARHKTERAKTAQMIRTNVFLGIMKTS